MVLKDWKKHTGLSDYYFKGKGKTASVIEYFVMSDATKSGAWRVVVTLNRGNSHFHKDFKTEKGAVAYMKNYMRLH